MIDTKELRCGNLVEKNGVEYVADFITIQMAHNYNPIPLTTEILEKCGFNLYYEANPDYYIQHELLQVFEVEDNFGYWIKEKRLEFGYYGKKKVEYVHQLQNLYYALTQKELEIKL